jgi:hypothetical protein
METIKIFDYKVCRFKCSDATLFRTEELIFGIDKIFNNSDLDDDLDNQMKHGVSTFGIEKYKLLDTNGISQLISWIKSRILEASSFFGYNNATDVDILQSFTNKMWPGATGKVHNHTNNRHGVIVFYFQQPDNGSDLVIVKDSFIGDDLKDISEENKFYLNVKQGDLVIHETNAWHGVSLHKGTAPRIVFVLEFDYV